MTIGTTNRADATGNDSATVFPYTFKIFAATALEVKVKKTSDGTITTLTYPTHYTVSGVGVAAGGNVTLTDVDGAWQNASDGTLKTGYTIAIRRLVAVSQTTDIRNQGGFFADVHEDEFDYLTMIDQQQQNDLDRAVKIDSAYSAAAFNPALPTPVASSAIGFNAAGTGLALISSLAGVATTAFTQTLLDDTTSNQALGTLTATRSETGAVAVPILTKFKEGPSLFDFIPTDLHAGIIARTNTTNLAAFIQAAIDALSTGETVLAYPGAYRLESALTIQGLIHLEGAGGGQVSQPAVTAPVTFDWYGGAAAMINWGNQATVKVGGGIRGVRLNGRAIATQCLKIKDAQHGVFENLLLTGAITHALELTNTDGLDPTAFHQFDNLRIQLRGGSTNAAGGIYLNGVGTGTAGVTICRFRAPIIEHANGHGLTFGLRGDGHLFENFYAFRANTTETGYGIYFSSTSTIAVNTTNRFVGNTIAVGGVGIVAPSGATATLGSVGSFIEGLNSTELASDIVDRYDPGQGAAKALAWGKTDKGFRLGMSRIANHFQSRSFDAMRFVAHTFPLLNTSDGSWFGVRTGAGGTITNAGQPGGGIALTTDAASGDDTAIYASSDFASGVSLSLSPYMMFTATPVGTITTMRTQFGMFDGSGTPDATNGVYVQYDPAVNANFQCISRKAGVSTAITTGIVGAAAVRHWLIVLTVNIEVYFFTKLQTEYVWTYLGVTTTNVPVVALTPGFRVETNTAAARVAFVYSSEYGHTHE